MPKPVYYAMPDGRVLRQYDLAKELGMTSQGLRDRIKTWGLEKAISTPLLHRLYDKYQPRAPTPAHQGIMQWCPTHRQALTHTEATGWVWEPFNVAVLIIAQAYAKAFGCPGQIQVEVIDCPQCPAREGKEA